MDGSFQPGAVWRSGSVGHQPVRVSFITRREISEEVPPHTPEATGPA